MAVITDPDFLNRDEVVYGSESQTISVFPVGTQRTGGFEDCWVANTSAIVRADGVNWSTDSVASGDIIVLYEGPQAGHWFVNGVTTTSAQLTDIDNGSAGAATTSLTVDDISYTETTDTATSGDITITSHGKVTGDAVIADAAGTIDANLTDGATYYVIRVDANTLALATSYANALAGTKITLADGGTGTTTLHRRIIAKAFVNGALTSEAINGNDTSGDGTGNALDGATLQAVYSDSKDEWRVDSLNATYNDDLIRHEFPFESITGEQFEIGGGASHDDWDFFNEYSRKKIRTGGFDHLENTLGANTIRTDTGIITLGTLDADAQVYYQQTSATTAPVDFTFLSAVNEPIQVYLDSDGNGTPDNDFRTYLKLFVRKKGKTYATSEIADIGVTTIQNIVNRFPLSHADDAAITNTDAEILGTSPWRQTFATAATAADGSVTSGNLYVTSASADFTTDNIVAGDTIHLENTATNGYFTIASVVNSTAVSIAPDFEFPSTGFSNTQGSISYTIYSPYRVGNKTGGTVADYTTPGSNGIIDVTPNEVAAGALGHIEDQTVDLSGVAVGDFLHITSPAANYGLYKVVDSSYDTAAAAPTSNVVFVNTKDQPFPASKTVANYKVFVPGMYLEFKDTVDDTINSGSGATQIDYYANGTIQLTGDTWEANVGPGTMLVVSGSTNNDGRLTVATRDGATNVTCISTDVVTTESDTTPSSTISVREGFKRDIGGVTYAFNWRVDASVVGSADAGLSDVFQFIQHQLRQNGTADVGDGAGDIDFGSGTARGDITDLLMNFSTPTGTTLNMYIDGLLSDDINNATFQDHSSVNRNFPFTASGSLNFNNNLVNDSGGKYWLFFTNDDAGDNLGRDYGTKDAIIVDDADGVDIAGNISGSTVSFTYDYDNNVQRGSGSAGVNAPVTLVAIGLETAQFVVSTGTISRTTGISISAVASLERNYIP